MYGIKGRIISGLAIVSAFLGSLESANVVTVLPDKYKWIGLVATFGGLIIAGFSERLQGGASKPEVRDAAAASDRKKEIGL